MLKTTLIFCRDSIYLLPSIVSGLVWVGLINVCVRSAAACVAASSEDILGNGGEGVAGKNSVVSDTCSLVVLVV